MNTRSKRIAWTPKHYTRTNIHNSGYTIKQNKGKSYYKCDQCKLIFKTIPGVKSHLRSCNTENTKEILNRNDSTTTEVPKTMCNADIEEGSSSCVKISDKGVDITSAECSSELNSDAQDENNENHVKEVKEDNMDVFINIISDGNSSEQDVKIDTSDKSIKAETSKIEEKECCQEKKETKKKYGCAYCHKTFVSIGSYQSHIDTKHLKQKKKNISYSCHYCPRTFLTKGRFEQHTKWHQERKTYQCDLCSKRYYNYGQIIRHLSSHEPNNPWQCNICSKVLSCEKFLKSHMRIHTGEKPYQCTVCPEMFGFKHHLVKHMLKHDIVKPYQCKICLKCYDNLQTYEKHVGTHNYYVDPVYICHECWSRFDDYTSLKLHRKVHDIQLHYCSVCTNKYIKEENLVEHMKSHL